MAEQHLAFETDIIRQAQNGSQEAFRTLYERYSDAIYRYIYKRVGESSEAEDLTQTVFVKAWQALRDYQISGAPFQAWLYRIAHNAIVDHYRTRRDPLLWDDLAGLADPHSTPESGLLRAEQQAVVQDALAELRPSYRDVLVRRFLYNMDYAETAHELGQQVNNIRVLQHRALEALRRVLAANTALHLGSIAAVLCLLLSGPLVVAAQRSLPGDQLYPMRTAVEDVRLWLADDVGDLRLHTDFADQRVAALADLHQQNRTADLATAVSDLTEHLRAAAATIKTLTLVKPETHEALRAQLNAALQRQSTTLNTLATSAGAEVQTTLQPAIKAVRDVQAVLRQPPADPSPPADAEPTPTAPLPATSVPATATPWPTRPSLSSTEATTPTRTIHVVPHSGEPRRPAHEEEASDSHLIVLPTPADPRPLPSDAPVRQVETAEPPAPRDLSAQYPELTEDEQSAFREQAAAADDQQAPPPPVAPITTRGAPPPPAEETAPVQHLEDQPPAEQDASDDGASHPAPPTSMTAGQERPPRDVAPPAATPPADEPAVDQTAAEEERAAPPTQPAPQPDPSRPVDRPPEGEKPEERQPEHSPDERPRPADQEER